MGCKDGGPARLVTSTYSAESERVVRTRKSVSEAAEQTISQTGNLLPYVDPKVKPRISRNSFEERPDGTYVLIYGPAISILDIIDGTGSFAAWFTQTYLQAGWLNGFSQPVFPGFNIQSSVGIIQDRLDMIRLSTYNTRLVAYLQTMWEADAKKLSEQITNMKPANDGKDLPEDYQLVLPQVWFRNEFDSARYGHWPYILVTGDDIGRPLIVAGDVEEHLGFTMQTRDTAEFAKEVLKKAHLFFLNVGDDRHTNNWWKNVIGNRVVHLPDAKYAAAMKVGLIYVTNNAQVSRSGFADFLTTTTRGNNYSITSTEAGKLFDLIQRAEVPFGAQPKVEMPKAGDIFDHPRNPWPIGHRLYVPYQQLGLPDPKSDVETPFTPLAKSIDLREFPLTAKPGTGSPAPTKPPKSSKPSKPAPPAEEPDWNDV